MHRSARHEPCQMPTAKCLMPLSGMAADNGRQVLVCINCKLRKKKCDKVQPRCGYCTQKNLECRYYSPEYKPSTVVPKALPSVRSPLIQSSLLLSSTLSEVLASEPTSTESVLYLQILRIIRATGRYVDDVTTRYFRGIHRFILVISSPRFHDQLMNSENPPPTSFSVLLLSMCLITHHRDLTPADTSTIDQSILYLATKTLFAQVQASSPPSLHLIQAGIIIASYEYASEKIQDAFANIAVCARMGYTIGLDKVRPVEDKDQSIYEQEEEEEANTWWGVLIMERTILCELPEFTTPLSTTMPSADTPLPSDPALSDIEIDIAPGPGPPVNDAGGFACVAQGVSLLDQVISAFEIPDPNAKLNRLNGLHHALRTVLGTVLDAGHPMGAFCTANGILIRTMYLIHWHILTQVSQMTTFKHKSREEWNRNSRAALETATKMMEDIAESQNAYALHMIDGWPPSSRYLLRAALEHIESLDSGVGETVISREHILTSLNKFEYRWGTCDSPDKFEP